MKKIKITVLFFITVLCAVSMSACGIFNSGGNNNGNNNGNGGGKGNGNRAESVTITGRPDGDKIEFAADLKLNFGYTVYPADADYGDVIWSVSDTAVAVFSESAGMKLNVLKAGRTTVTATVDDTDIKDSFELVVIEQSLKILKEGEPTGAKIIVIASSGSTDGIAAVKNDGTALEINTEGKSLGAPAVALKFSSALPDNTVYYLSYKMQVDSANGIDADKTYFSGVNGEAKIGQNSQSRIYHMAGGGEIKLSDKGKTLVRTCLFTTAAPDYDISVDSLGKNAVRLLSFDTAAKLHITISDVVLAKAGAENFTSQYTSEESAPYTEKPDTFSLPASSGPEGQIFYLRSFKFKPASSYIQIDLSCVAVIPLYSVSEISSSADADKITVFNRNNAAYDLKVITSGATAGTSFKVKLMILGIGDFIRSAVIAKSGQGYINQRETYFYGVAEKIFEGNSNNDPAYTPQKAFDLVGALGVSTMRYTMEMTRVLKSDSSNNITLNDDAPNNWVTKYHNYAAELKAQGVNRLIAGGVYFLYPNGYNKNGKERPFPEPGSTHYKKFMEMVEESAFILAREFPEIEYWEWGNEVNHDAFCYPASGTFTTEQKAHVITDFSYFVYKGCKRGNPNSVVVMPSVCNKENQEVFLDTYYDNITSGNFPSVAGYEKESDTDRYFEVLNWHPYHWNNANTVSGSAWQQLNNRLYQIAKDHGDDGKKVIFTEFGYTTTGDIDAGYSVGSGYGAAVRDAKENLQAGFFRQAMQDIWANCPYVETVCLFKLFDWDNASSDDYKEAGFGLFTSPGGATNANRYADAYINGTRPKKIALELFKMINGNSADTTPLYKYYSGSIPA